MDGIRELANIWADKMEFESPVSPGLATITITSASQRSKPRLLEVQQTDLRAFFQDSTAGEGNPYESTLSHTLKLVCVGANPDVLFIEKFVFTDICDKIGLDPWAKRLLHTRAYGYYRFGHMNENNIATSYLGTSFVFTAWTTRQVQSQYVTRVLVIDPEGTVNQGAHASFHRLTQLTRNLTLFENDIPSPLYFPFVLSVDTWVWRELGLEAALRVVRDTESQSGHGSWGRGRFDNKMDNITDLTSKLGSALNTIGNTFKHLSMVETIWADLERLVNEELLGEDMADESRASTNSILQAIGLLRQKAYNAREQAQYLELRIRNQTSLVSFSSLS